MTKRTPARETHQQATIRMVNDPMSWPHLVLPLKKYVGHDLQVACLAATLEDKPAYKIARNTNLWSLGDSDYTATWEDTTPDKVLQEGWLVD